MANNYFNKWEFMQAFSNSETNPEEAKSRFEEYLQKYPKDYSTYPYYLSVLITLGDFKEAKKVLEYIKKKYIKDGSFNNKINKVKILEQKILFNELKLLSYEEKYDEMYDLFYKNYNDVKAIELNHHIEFYINKKTNRLGTFDKKIKSYIYKQIFKYEEHAFLKHIRKHQADYNQNLDNPDKNIFLPNFPINEVLDEVKKYIMSDKRLYPGFMEDTYYFKYNECGRDNDKLVDYFKVICFHNTKDFITMFPIGGCENLPYVDLNYLVCDKQNYKVKKISQIHKFNQRYKIN